MKLLLSLSMMLTCLFPLMLHPLAMTITLLMLTLMTSMLMSISLSFSWLAYMVFLVMIGGLLVLFIYIASLAPNNKMFSLSIISFIPIIVLFMLKNSSTSKDLSLLYISQPMKQVFSPLACQMTLIMALFLLFTLLVIVLITKFTVGPLRLFD